MPQDAAKIKQNYDLTRNLGECFVRLGGRRPGPVGGADPGLGVRDAGPVNLSIKSKERFGRLVIPAPQYHHRPENNL